MAVQKMIHPSLSERMNRIDSSKIRKAFDLAAKLKDPINLSIGQPHFPAPTEIADAMDRAMRDGKTSYTETMGILPLRERLSRKFKEVNGFDAPPEQILVSAGVAPLLQLLFMAVVDPGDRVLITDPAFLIYRSMLQFYGARLETIPENFTPEDVERIRPEGIKLILFSNPSNPSGYIMTGTQLQALGNLADRSGGYLVSDEIYELFDYDKTFVSAASLVPRAVTLTGFSKSYNMTGLRLAAAAGPQELIQAMTTIQQYSIVCAPAPVQWAGIAALDLDMSSYVDEYRINRDLMVDALSSLVRFEKPGGAFYIFPDIGMDDQEFVERAIQEKQLILVPGNIFSASRTHIRISYATSRENLERGIGALKDLLS